MNIIKRIITIVLVILMFVFSLGVYADSYLIKIWFEDTNNERMSPVYTKEISVVPIVKTVGYGYAYATYEDTNGADTIIKTIIYDENLNENTYTYAKNFEMNGTDYSHHNISISNMSVVNKTFVKYVAYDNEIVSIYTSQTSQEYKNVTYNKETESFNIYGVNTKGLPVFYGDLSYRDLEILYLDEQHMYDVVVYDYGVNIIDYYAIDNLATAKFDVGTMLIDNELSLYLDYEINRDYNRVRIELYDEDMNFISDDLNPEVENEEYKYELAANNFIGYSYLSFDLNSLKDLGIPALTSVTKVFNKPYTYKNDKGVEETVASGVTFAKAEKSYADYTLVEYGMLFTKENIEISDFLIGKEKIQKAKGEAIGQSGRYYGILFYGPGIKFGETYYTLPYAIYENTNGEQITVYGQNKTSFTPEEE